MASKKVRGITTYTKYQFEDKDPALGAFKTALQDSGMSHKDVHDAGGPTPNTLNRWDFGKTRTARMDTYMAAVRACKGSVTLRTASGREVKIEPKTPKKR